MSESGHHPTTELIGGVVAFNEERHLAAAVESLLAQQLPPNIHWRTIWVVASGCTDRTPEVARELATKYPEVQIIFQPERRGKASALGEIFRRVRGDFLVLLNADARALPGAVAALLRSARLLAPPFGVMGRPEPAETPPDGIGRGIQLQWNLHHRLHFELISTGQGTHLSDELLLLPAGALPPLPEGVVNDGAFIGGWLRSHGGRLEYAVDAPVSIEVPFTLADHLRQRRRIHVGHHQVKQLVGVAPTTLGNYLLRCPGRALAILAAGTRGSRGKWAALAWLAAAELAAGIAALWDRIPPRRTHRLWVPIRERRDLPEPFGPRVVRTSASQAPFDQAG
jgi:poly-beta-1,6-N-acetyl-D-glucosamine synthase